MDNVQKHNNCILRLCYDRKLHFHRHVDYIHSQALKLLRLIPFITYNFSSSESLKIVYFTLIRSKLEYTSVVWNNLILQILRVISSKTYDDSLQIYAIIDLFRPPPFVIMNQCWIIYILKSFVCMYKGWAIKLALAPRPLMIYCASPFGRCDDYNCSCPAYCTCTWKQANIAC
jgi:hypothetical protein